MLALLRKWLCLAGLLGVTLLPAGAGAAPVGAAMMGAPAQPLPALSHVLPAAGDCREGDCPTVIDIVPYPAPPRDDPIAREIERFGSPAPLEPCEEKPVVTQGRRATHDADSCGIRCWYWRLRHGYCGPGCDYYRYRLGLRDREGIPVRKHPRSACRS